MGRKRGREGGLKGLSFNLLVVPGEVVKERGWGREGRKAMVCMGCPGGMQQAEQGEVS